MDTSCEIFELRVLSGLHQGAALPLFGECWSIGASEEADLGLYDPGVHVRHAQLQRTGEHWSLQAQEGLLQDDAGATLAYISNLVPGAEFSLGGIRLCVAHTESSWPQAPSHSPFEPGDTLTGKVPETSKKAAKKPIAGALAALVLVLAGSFFLSRDEDVHLEVPVPVVNEKRVLLTAIDVHRQLLSMLSDRELSAHVILESTNHQVTLRGDVQVEQLALVSRMLKRFQLQFDTSITIHNKVQLISRELPFKIVQIIGGPKAHVVLGDGRRLFFGDEVDGVRLTVIENNRLLFEGRQRYEVSW